MPKKKTKKKTYKQPFILSFYGAKPKDKPKRLTKLTVAEIEFIKREWT